MHLVEFLAGFSILANIPDGHYNVLVTEKGYAHVRMKKPFYGTGPCSLCNPYSPLGDDDVYAEFLVGSQYMEINLSAHDDIHKTTAGTVEHLDYLYMGANWERVANSTVGIPGTDKWIVCPEDWFPVGSLFNKAAAEFYHVLDMAKDIYDQGDVSWEDAILTAKFEYAKPGNLFLAHATLEDLLQELGVL